ncbi:hypothetical protein [Pedobacter sp. GR22-6]|uniref:hypothetical protein n=1 Tax=Pedobacter sp. GR22-6 TaxID=3127957 RepID=UPI00307F91BD
MKNRSRAGQKVKEARQREKDGDLKAAEKLYQSVLKINSDEHVVYDRLMIIYRRQKNSQKEINIIKLAINNFKTSYLEKQKAWIENNEIIAGLSKDLAISLGLMDKDGLPLNADPLLIKWEKRLTLLEQRMEKRKPGNRTTAAKSTGTTKHKTKSIIGPKGKTENQKKIKSRA